MTAMAIIKGTLSISDIPAESSAVSRFLGANSSNKVVSRSASQVRSDISARASNDEYVVVLDISRSEDARLQISDGVYRFLVTRRMTITNIFVDVSASPDGGDTLIDVKDSTMSSILQSQLRIPSGLNNNISYPSLMATSVFNPGDVLRFDVTDTAPALPGSGLKAYILYY